MNLKPRFIPLLVFISIGFMDSSFAAKPILKCSPASGITTLTLRTAKDLPIKFGAIGNNKLGEIIWMSHLDKQVTTMKKSTSNTQGKVKRQLKGYIGKDVGRFFVRYKNQAALVPIDSSLFTVRSPAAVTGDGDLRVCGYMPTTGQQGSSTSTTVSCGTLPQSSTYTAECIGSSDPFCRSNQIKKWQEALDAYSKCGSSNSPSGGASQDFSGSSNYCIVHGARDPRCGNYDGSLDNRWWD